MTAPAQAHERVKRFGPMKRTQDRQRPPEEVAQSHMPSEEGSGLQPGKPRDRRFSLDETCAQAVDDVRPWQSVPHRQIVRSPHRRGDAGA